METKQKTAPIFADLSNSGAIFEDEDFGPTQISSLCLKCYEEGETKLLLTKIPFFKDVVISSFSCEQCNFKNNEIMSASKIQDEGIKYTFKMKDSRDLQRNIVRSEHCAISIPELGFDIPITATSKGIFTTIEGLLSRAFQDIQKDQPLRRIQQPEIVTQIDTFLQTAKQMTGVTWKSLFGDNDDDVIENLPEPSCTIVFTDPSGNSYIENPHAPYPDPRCRVDHFPRTDDMNELIGLYKKEQDLAVDCNGDGNNKNKKIQRSDLVSIPEEYKNEKFINETTPIRNTNPIPEAHGGVDLNQEVLTIKSNCSSCNAVCDVNFKSVEIPFFKTVIIMATVCDICGYKSNEVKSGSGFEKMGQKIVLKIFGKNDEKRNENFDVKIDLARDVLKSDTCDISIPELDFTLGRGALEGKFTTVEGLLQDVTRIIKTNPFTTGDSSLIQNKTNLNNFVIKLEQIQTGNMSITLILDDPTGNSYIQNINAPDVDPQLSIISYERTFEQNEDLGLNDMKTENY